MNMNHNPYQLAEWKQRVENNRQLTHLWPGNLWNDWIPLVLAIRA
jgi:hypothetical protein